MLVSERVARADALAEVERAAERLARSVVRPLLEDALAATPPRWAELERVVTDRLQDGSLSAVVVWSGDGEVLWADDAQRVGRIADGNAELAEALAEGTTVSDVDEHPESGYGDEGAGPKLEVYVPITVRGDPVAVEVYYDFLGVERQARLLRGGIIPLAVGALVVLQLVQLPIALSWARRLRREEAERAGLMQRSLTASERERRDIAADVHDGPVQDLAGVGYALTALRDSLPPDRLPAVDRVIGAVRNAVASLRRLMIEIYPPDLSGPGLPVAVEDLAEPLRDRGVTVDVTAGPLPDMPPAVVAVLYRSAREALSNVAHHSGAGRVHVALLQLGDGRVRLEVSDDGAGFPSLGPDVTPEGHLGLRLLRDRVAGVGGEVELANLPDGGAVVCVTVPVEDAP
ncbi:sensor histidine kinase [Geodermatophilus sp. SYSU D00815]